MSAFEKHGIRHLSASSLGLWRENPGLWSLKYLGGMKDDAGPAAWRGSAVEGGMLALLHGRELAEAKEKALSAFDATCQGELSDEIAAERALISPMLDVIATMPKQPSPLVASQIKVECWLDEVDAPLIGYIDFVFEDGTVLDLKTTKACPSSAKAPHVRQVSAYMLARRTDLGGLVYVTGKKFANYGITPEERDFAIKDLTRDALSLQRFLERFDTPMQAMDVLPMNTDDFRWSDAATEFLMKLEAA
ncbi:PD-(D/E)XK nuclease family protein [Xanthobacter sp. V3C-3]|uniref:PD-(D/E)XK nuclease family protein n=1 Tax=Xanthobacter lutulentifluminis TaxID=3119935 RepID=UPI00372A272C